MVALITGGVHGIGLATARWFASQGHKVCLFDLKGAEEAARQFGVGTVGVDGNITNAADVDRAIERTIEAFGGLDCLVTCAGIVKVAPALDFELEDFASIISVNVTGSFLPAQRAARVMVKSGGGSIVFVGSVYGAAGAPQRTAYCASKGAVHTMTQALAVEWGPLGIRVNAVAPTGTRTPMVQDLIDRGIYDLSGVKARTPLGRLAEAEEVAATIGFLASPSASMINGVIFPVDGGWLANGYTIG